MKIWVICLFIMFTTGLMVIKMSEMVYFLFFLPITAKHQTQFGKNIYVQLKDLIWFFRKRYGFLDSEILIQDSLISLLTWQFFYISIVRDLLNSNYKSYWPYYFLKEMKKFFQVRLNLFPKLWSVFCCYQ